MKGADDGYARRRARGSTPAAVVGLVAALLVPLQARAARGASVRAEVIGCAGAPAPAWGSASLGLLAVELAPDGVACCEGAGDLRASLFAVCEPRGDDSQVDVRVIDETGTRAASRRVDLADVPVLARPRTLALAVAEAVRGVRHDVVGESSATPPAASGAGATISVNAGPFLRVYPRTETTAWGGGLGAELARGWAAADLGVGLALATRSVPEGNVTLRLVGLSLGASARARRGANVFSVGPQLTADRVHVSGTPTSAGVVGGDGGGWGLALLARVGLVRELGQGLRVWGATGLGPVLRSVEARADGARVAGVSGLVWSLAFGLGWDRF